MSMNIRRFLCFWYKIDKWTKKKKKKKNFFKKYLLHISWGGNPGLSNISLELIEYLPAMFNQHWHGSLVRIVGDRIGQTCQQDMRPRLAQHGWQQRLLDLGQVGGTDHGGVLDAWLITSRLDYRKISIDVWIADDKKFTHKFDRHPLRTLYWECKNHETTTTRLTWHISSICINDNQLVPKKYKKKFFSFYPTIYLRIQINPKQLSLFLLLLNCTDTAEGLLHVGSLTL